MDTTKKNKILLSLGALILMFFVFSKKKQKIEGGLGDDTLEGSVNPKELKMGIEVEMEHTFDPDIAKEIALDHLTEDPMYYTHLKEMERKYIK